MNWTSRICAIVAGILAIASLRSDFSGAQTTTPADPNNTNVPPTPPVISSGSPVVSPSTTQGSPTMLTFNFQDASLDAVLDYLSQEAGFVVVKIKPATGTVTMFTRHPITPDEAIVYLNSALKGEDLTAIQMGKLLKIDSIDDAKHSNIPVRVGDDPDKIDDTDQYITQVIPLRSVDAVKLKTDLQPLVDTDADLTANAASNSLMVTDTSANVRRIVQIVSSLDSHESAASDIRVRQLKYADATAAAQLIMAIFSPPATNTQQGNGPFGNLPFFLRGGGGGGGPGGGGGFGGGGGGFGGGGGGFGGGRGGGGPGGGGGAAAAAQADSGNTGHVEASADERTNTIVVSGPPDTLHIIDGVLNQLDANPAAEQDFFIYRVKNGQAVDMASTLNGLFSGTPATSSTASRSQFASGTGNRVAGSSSFGGGGGGGGGFGGGGGGLGGGGGGFGGGGGGTSSFGASRSTSTSGTSANPLAARAVSGGTTGTAASASSVGGVADLIGQVFVVADQDTNSLLVATATKYEAQVKEVINQLDSRVQQVLIKVLIAEVTHDNALDYGTDFSVLDSRASGSGEKIGTTLGAAAAAAASATGAGGLVTSLLEANVSATLQALAQQNKLDVLSRPYILTSDNQEADITVGSEVPFITNSTIDENGGIHNTPEYQDIGIVLEVTPHINPEGLVTMLVSPQISSQTSQTVQISEGVNLPVFDVQSADSYLTVRDGQTVVIGGMMQDQKTVAINKIPLLGDIPLIGPLFFSYNSFSKQKTELLIFLTPHVAAEPDLLKPMGEDEMHGMRLVPNAVEPGEFQEHLRGMERGGASSQPTTGYIPPPGPPRSWLEPPQPGDY